MVTARTALVTGGTGGIGTAIVEKLAAAGHRVATNYRNEEKTRAWQDKMKAQGVDVLTVKGDVSDPEDCERMVQDIQAELGPVEILVNNAGITRDTTFHKMSPGQWTDVITTNLNSVYNVTRPVIGGMREGGWGRIVQIASINGQKGQYGQANYAAAKAGMHGFTISLAQENAKFGVTVNTVSPGYVGTEMVMAVPEEVRAKIAAQIPVGRLGKPEEIAYAVAFFLPDDAAWVTGTNLSINGGHYMGW
ncbi:acetoacetyl-CoA reductase [Ornithinimicrobium cryptoxanthini]|uniref:Acetoacetyl-CoA reductase n=1 Tax=Ornithinimicrobium cryptoxanthini TaxID=2934161 RepID=A0ABY4YMM6_9MICO|nr:acetoacetyl-CoA reductase [Ornithinimicrobium cryptoxanthini]USQ77745.1 acetoacetyl-CoA reductase [Ornithinimicrobium cryptoxanthini]